MHVFLYPSKPTWCRLSPRWPGVRADAVVCACARFPTEYDSKGYGLMRLAGHTLRHWPVSSRPCDRRTSRPALHRVAWEAAFSHTTFVHATLAHTHTTLLHATFSHTTRSDSYITILQLPHAHNSCTHNCFTLVHHTVQTHTQLFHIRLCDRQSFTHTTWSHTIFHTHNFVPHSFHTQLYHTQLFAYNFFNLSILHHLLCLSFLPRPASTFGLIIGRS